MRTDERLVVQLGPGCRALGGLGDLGERVVGEVSAHVFAGDVPDCEQDAVTLVVAGTVLVWLTEVAEGDRSVCCRDDVREADLFGTLGEHVTTADATLGLHESGAFQDEEDLFEIGLGESGSRGDVAHGGRTGVVFVQGE